MRIVVTRPAQEAARWVLQLRAGGHEAIALPLMAIHPAPDPQALATARAALAQYAAVMFVSGNAVQGLLGEGLAWPRGVRAWAPGPATGELLLRSGVPADRVDAPAEDAPQFDSESLWDRVQGQLQRGQRLLLVRGAGADGRARGRDWLAQQLAAAGVQVDEVAAYVRGLPAWSADEQDLAHQAAGDGSLWLFSSSEAAANLGQLLPGQDWAAGRALATHPRIAAAVRELGFGYVQESRPALAEVMASIESSR